MVTGGFSPDIAFLNSDGLNAVLNFLNSDTQTRVVATPRTVTQNAVEALLEVTRAFPIFQESPGSQAVPATTAIIYTNLGTILRVTPRISADDSVMLQVSPEVSNVDGKDQSQVGGRISEANIYAIRRMETTVRVPSGHTLVMGGLTSDTRTRKQNKVPLLGDIPLLGKAFQNREKNQENQNLIVFITPTIVREDDFQQSETDFLRTKFDPGESDITFDSMWDSAEPYSW
jgi:type II secretory pathway component GspD/PulD (secretin)